MTLIDPVLGTPAVVPALGGFGYLPFPDAQPFSQRTASGYQESLEYIIFYMQRKLYPYLKEIAPQGAWDANVTALIAAVDAALEAQTADNAQRIADALDQLVHSSITITDPAILVVLQKADSATRQWINNNVVTPDTVKAAYAKTGSSFKAQLDQDYDSDVRSDFANILGLNVIVAPAPKGNGQDDTAALRAVIDPMHAVGGTVLLQRGLYRANLDLPAQFQQVKIVGQGMWATEIRSYSTDASAAVVKFNGGSGAFGGGGIEELTLSSADGVTQRNKALVFSGTTGCTARHVRIRGSFAQGVVFWNERGGNGTGDFTEFNTFCDGDISGCYAPIVYASSNGVESFHGSGLVGNNTINIPSDMTGPIIAIGGNSLPYNAPMNFTLWFQQGKDTWLFDCGQNGAGRDRSFYGNIRCENNTGVTASPMGRGYNRVLFMGGISWLGAGSSKLGNIFLCKKIGYEGGTVYGELHPVSSDAPLKNSPTIIATAFEGDALHLVAVRVTAPNYEFHALLLVQRSAFDGSQAFINEISRTQDLDSGNKGDPQFYFNNALYCASPNFSPQFHAYVTVTPLGGGSGSQMLSQAVFG